MTASASSFLAAGVAQEDVGVKQFSSPFVNTAHMDKQQECFSTQEYDRSTE
jgi:hypothetical protein